MAEQAFRDQVQRIEADVQRKISLVRSDEKSPENKIVVALGSKESKACSTEDKSVQSNYVEQAYLKSEILEFLKIFEVKYKDDSAQALQDLESDIHTHELSKFDGNHLAKILWTIIKIDQTLPPQSPLLTLHLWQKFEAIYGYDVLISRILGQDKGFIYHLVRLEGKRAQEIAKFFMRIAPKTFLMLAELNKDDMRDRCQLYFDWHNQNPFSTFLDLILNLQMMMNKTVTLTDLTELTISINEQSHLFNLAFDAGRQPFAVRPTCTALANSLPKFSLDIVGIVAGYAIYPVSQLFRRIAAESGVSDETSALFLGLSHKRESKQVQAPSPAKDGASKVAIQSDYLVQQFVSDQIIDDQIKEELLQVGCYLRFRAEKAWNRLLKDLTEFDRQRELNQTALMVSSKEKDPLTSTGFGYVTSGSPHALGRRLLSTAAGPAALLTAPPVVPATPPSLVLNPFG